ELLGNVALNRAANVVVRGEALADAPGEATFFLGPQNHRGTSSLRALPANSGEIRVRKARLDDLLPLGTRVHLVKIDVEGAEYLVLRGMEACLRRDQPDLIVEVTDEYLRGLGHSAEGLCEFLFGLGYRMYIIDHPGLRPVAAARDIPPGQYNALFTAS